MINYMLQNNRMRLKPLTNLSLTRSAHFPAHGESDLHFQGFVSSLGNSLSSFGAYGDALNALKTNLVDPNGVLESWDPTFDNPCNWFHVTCNSYNSVTHVALGNANLSGQLVPELGQLPNLHYLELYCNNIFGKMPNELGNLTNLVSLDLHLNKLTGPIPNTLANLKKLRFLRLNNNNLSGNIPLSFTTVNSLQVLDLSNNNLTGDVPISGSFSLFSTNSFKNNPHLHKKSTPTPLQKKLYPTSMQQATSDKITTGVISGGAAVGVMLLFVAPAVACAYWHRRKLRNDSVDVPVEEDLEVQLGQLKRFSVRELQKATDNFNDKNVIGKGGSGKVYIGRLTDGSLAAIKRLKGERTQGGELRFQTEVEIISLAVHRHLLRLRGFCMTTTERLLVYPFMVNGSVASCLQERPKSKPALNWQIRMRAALGAARGIAYLHDHCHPQIIHRDVKAANILLDEEFEAVVADFGLAKLMNYQDAHGTTAVIGSIGHIAPEYLATGKISDKSDVYGYGVMLLELITGQKAFNLARHANNEDLMLLHWVKGILKDKRLETLVDADLKGDYNKEEVEQLIQVALLCTQDSPLARPRMSEVIRMLEGDGLAEKWDLWQKEELISKDFGYPYMSNGSVASCLRDRPDSQPALEWSKRKRIALEAARGLAYLHDHCDPKIIHRDVKAANILLDDDFEAVVGDFGLMKLMNYKDTHVTTAVRGTVGHIAPKYFSTRKCSEKTDVFGYGVMLLKLITGQSLARLANDDDVMLLDWVKGLLKDRMLETLVDADLEGNYDVEEVEEVIQVALLCTQGSPVERPKMSEVVRMLDGDGLAEKCDQWWQKEEMIRQNFSTSNHHTANWILDSTSNIIADELSGPR
ncbi:hypothetical protein RJT34_04122 [Clitoria ternatea]|uniref:non-specific serine/threonine protein kinase n=1 Tax=Clitoria ternatea TaxID=43366 RepID=A0AAN9Q1X5_CLITE